MKTYKELKVELARANETVFRLKLEMARLEDQVLIDPLTGLPNFRALESRLGQAVSEVCRGRSHYIVMADVDNFKRINDLFGHQIGNDVLKYVADVIKKSSRDMDFVSRYGGEEFCLILTDVDHDEAIRIAERIRLTLACGSFGCISVTASFGVSVLSENINLGLYNADSSLRQAKISGKNKVVS